MNEKSFISVIMPVYNVEKFLEEAINSLFNQTIEDFEIIAVDDCSTDNSLNILTKMQALDKRLKVFRNDRNLKIASTLNRAFFESSGQYIVRMDGDDVSANDRLETLLNFIERNNRYDIVASSMTTIDENGLYISKAYYSNSNGFLMKTLAYSSPLPHIWIAKRQVYNALMGYRQLSGAEDYDFLLRALSNGFHITNISEYYGYIVRIRSGNTASLMGLRQILLHEYVYNLYLQRNKNKSSDDSFTLIDCEEYTRVRSVSLNCIHSFSNTSLRKALSHKKYSPLFYWYFFLSLISPYQWVYYKRRLMYRLYKVFYKC